MMKHIWVPNPLADSLDGTKFHSQPRVYADAGVCIQFIQGPLQGMMRWVIAPWFEPNRGLEFPGRELSFVCWHSSWPAVSA